MGRNHRRGKGGKGKTKRKGGGGSRPKLRFAYGDRVECRTNGGWGTGTIVKLWYDTEKDPETGEFHEGVSGFIAPYQMLMDNGDLLYAPADKECHVRKSDAPPMPVDHSIGTRVEVKLSKRIDEWRVGTVISADKDWVKNNYSPYYIKFDDGERHNFWGPEQYIRACPLRFKVGDRVERTSGDGWLPGTIVRLQVKNDFWQEGGSVPYEMRLDDGDLHCIPEDTDDHVRKSSAPPLEVQFARGARIECRESGDEWRPGSVVRSNEDWAQHDRPPYFLRFDDGKYEEFWGPQSSIRAASSIPSLVADRNELSLAGISDDDIFAPPPPRPECPICFIPLPIECDEYSNHPCCGETICIGCELAHTDDFGRRKACPFCRSPLWISDGEFLSLTRKRVELGDAEATFCLGCHYSVGDYGLPVNRKKAFELFLRAAELGSSRACTNVADEYLNGDGSIAENDEIEG